MELINICSVIFGQLVSLFKITTANSVLVSQKFQMQFKVLRKCNFSDSSQFHRIFDSQKFQVSSSAKNSLTWGVECEKLNFRKSEPWNLLDKQVRKIVREWNSDLEIVSLPQSIENSRQFLLLRTDILQKIVVGCPGRVKEVGFNVSNGKQKAVEVMPK